MSSDTSKNASSASNNASTIAVIANTKKIAKKEIDQLRRNLTAAGLDSACWHVIERGSDAKPKAAKAVKRGAQTVIVCGGDGTVRAAAEALVGTSAALAVVPAGTANLFASGLHLPSDIEEIVDLVARGDRRSIDTAECNGQTFNVMAGSGFDVGMLAQAEADKSQMGMVAYLRAGMSEVRDRKLFDTKITIDGDDFFDGEASCVLVGKIGASKAGFETFPEATPTDGKLHVAVVTAHGVREWAGLMASAVLHRQHRSDHAQLGEGCEVKVSFDGKRRFELDGGVKGKAKRLDFAVRPHSQIVCAPAA
ncbi:MAG TPA: diacylglycerol kinase family protein [Ilumatobacteraceae bacterium]|nr:diacylglycerol kinase family protein [Ilumatobacteraceae bacterium]